MTNPEGQREATCENCWISQELGEFKIEFCPLHASAPALHSALGRTLSLAKAVLANRAYACAEEAIAEAEYALALVKPCRTKEVRRSE